MTLRFDRLRKQYGSIVAVHDLSIVFEPGLIHGVIGPNGAGKSTLINMAAGSYTASGGRILLDEQEVSGLKKYEIANRGIARTYQNIRLFDQMTVLENLEVCFYPVDAGRAWREVLLPGYARRRVAERRAACLATLRLFDLEDAEDATSSSLSYGRQRMLEIARALVRDPRVLLLDEPAAGLNRHETAELAARLTALRSPERVLIVVEHDMDLIMKICDRIAVMHHGKLLFQGTPAQVQGNEEVQLAYLGTASDTDHIKAAAADRRTKLGVRAHQRPE